MFPLFALAGVVAVVVILSNVQKRGGGPGIATVGYQSLPMQAAGAVPLRRPLRRPAS